MVWFLVHTTKILEWGLAKSIFQNQRYEEGLVKYVHILQLAWLKILPKIPVQQKPTKMFYFVVTVTLSVIFSNSLIFVFCFDSVTQCQLRLHWVAGPTGQAGPFKSWAVMRNKLRTENWDLIISWSLFWFDQLRHLILRSAKRLEFRKFANNFYGYIPLWPEWFIPSQKWKLQQSCECKYILFCFNTSRKNERDT